MSNFMLFNDDRLSWYWLGGELSTMALVGISYAIFASVIKPRQAPVQPEELWKYAYMHKEKQIVEDWVAIVVLLVSMFLIVPLVIGLRFIKNWDARSVIDDAITFIIAYVNGGLLTLAVVELLKRTVARPRPDFLSRCLDTVDPMVIDDYIANHRHGTPIECIYMDESTKLISDGRLSFPSGHSAGSCFAYLFIALYAFQRLTPYERLGYFRVAIPGLLILFPLFVMVSRVMDNRHNPLDVLAGGIIGSVIATITYRYYYPFYHQPLVVPRKTWQLPDNCKLQRQNRSIFGEPTLQTTDAYEAAKNNNPHHANARPADFPLSTSSAEERV